MSSLGDRLKEVRGVQSRDTFAAQFSVHRNTLAAWEKGQTAPDARFLEELCQRYNVTPQWFLLGEGNKEVDDASHPVWRGQSVSLSALQSGNACMPIVALADDGMNGWCRKAKTAITTQRPAEFANNPHVFVTAAGCNCLQPEGVRQGFLCYCDPSNPAGPGDVVFVELLDDKAALRLLSAHKDNCITLQAWHTNSKGEAISPFYEDIDIKNIKLLAPAIYIKRKL